MATPARSSRPDAAHFLPWGLPAVEAWTVYDYAEGKPRWVEAFPYCRFHEQPQHAAARQAAARTGPKASVYPADHTAGQSRVACTGDRNPVQRANQVVPVTHHTAAKSPRPPPEVAGGALDVGRDVRWPLTEGEASVGSGADKTRPRAPYRRASPRPGVAPEIVVGTDVRCAVTPGMHGGAMLDPIVKALLAGSAAVVFAALVMIFGPKIMRQRTTDVSVLLLYVFALAPAIRQALSPPAVIATDYRGGIHYVTPPSTGLGLIVGQATTLAIVAIAAWVLLVWRTPGGEQHQPARCGRILVSAAAAFIVVRIAASVFGTGGDFSDTIEQLAVDLLVLLALTRRRWTWRELAPHASRIFRVYAYGSLLMLAVASERVTTAINQREVFGVDQLSGLTPHPNVLGPLAAAALLFEVIRRAPRWRLHMLAPLGCLVLVQSRTAWIAAGVGLVIAAFIRAPGDKRPRVWPYLVPIAVASTAMSLMVVSPGIEARLTAWVAGGSNGSLNGRLRIWQVAVDQFERNLMFGYGPTVFSPAFRTVHVSYGAGQAHGQVPQSMAEAGLLGLGALLFLCTALVVLAARPGQRRVLLPLVAVVLVHSISEAPFRGGISAQTVLVSIVLLLVLAANREGSDRVASPAEDQTGGRRQDQLSIAS